MLFTEVTWDVVVDQGWQSLKQLWAWGLMTLPWKEDSDMDSTDSEIKQEKHYTLLKFALSYHYGLTWLPEEQMSWSSFKISYALDRENNCHSTWHFNHHSFQSNPCLVFGCWVWLRWMHILQTISKDCARRLQWHEIEVAKANFPQWADKQPPSFFLCFSYFSSAVICQ